MNPQTTFQPLYTRHVSGCIIVANTSNPKSLERAFRWKEVFDKKTKVPDEPPVPATIFINHDHISSKRTPSQIKVMLGRVEDDDVVSAEKISESDLTATTPANIDDVK
jgi:signal recognition particle receptor subunit beta